MASTPAILTFQAPKRPQLCEFCAQRAETWSVHSSADCTAHRVGVRRAGRGAPREEASPTILILSEAYLFLSCSDRAVHCRHVATGLLTGKDGSFYGQFDTIGRQNPMAIARVQITPLGRKSGKTVCFPNLRAF